MRRTIQTRTFRAAGGLERTVSVARLEGGRPGPTLALIAGQHGMEHMGPVVLRRFLDTCPADFRGTVTVCPCANPFALELDYEYYPEREDLGKLKDYYYSRFRHDYSPFGLERDNPYNMNRLWGPSGRSGPGVANEIVAWLWDTACEPADVIIDFHSRNAERPLIYADCGIEVPLARFFGAQGIFAPRAPCTPGPDAAGHLTLQGNRGRRRAFCVEFSAQHGYRRPEIRMGLDGILNVMKGIGMLQGRVAHPHAIYLIRRGQSAPVCADAAGHIVYHREPYDEVSAGDLLFDVRSLERLDAPREGRAPMDGVMGEPTFRPIATPGMAVCAVHRAERLAAPGEVLEPLPWPWRD